MVDAVTLVLAAFVLLMLLGSLAQHALLGRLKERDAQMQKLTADKARLERRMAGLAKAGVIDVEGDKVIMQGEVLFDSGSDALTPGGQSHVLALSAPLTALLRAEPDQMVMVAGHTDDIPIHNARFDSNWELSSSRAVAVARLLMEQGVPQAQVLASGFGPMHPRVPNGSEGARRQNRRIEVLLVPIRSVTNP